MNIKDFESFEYNEKTGGFYCKSEKLGDITIFKRGLLWPRYVYFNGRVEDFMVVCGFYLVFEDRGFWPVTVPEQTPREVKVLYKSIRKKYISEGKLLWK